MKTQYEIFIDAVSCALEDHSFGTRWYFDFDEQTTVPAIEDVDCYPENGHRVLPIEPMSSWESFDIMEDFVNGVDNEVERDKLAVALNQRHPFSAFKEMLHYTAQREKWFAYKEKRMKEIVEQWMADNEVVYKDNHVCCNSSSVLKYNMEEREDEDNF